MDDINNRIIQAINTEFSSNDDFKNHSGPDKDELLKKLLLIIRGNKTNSELEELLKNPKELRNEILSAIVEISSSEEETPLDSDSTEKQFGEGEKSAKNKATAAIIAAGTIIGGAGAIALAGPAVAGMLHFLNQINNII